MAATSNKKVPGKQIKVACYRYYIERFDENIKKWVTSYIIYESVPTNYTTIQAGHDLWNNTSSGNILDELEKGYLKNDLIDIKVIYYE